MTKKSARQAAASDARLRSLFPSFSASSYAQAQRRREQELPPGVRHPGVWIKDQGPLKVEPKVWLANQRTFVKWQHVTVLLMMLSVSLYNAAGENNKIARGLALVYTLVAAFCGTWGWGVYMYRNQLIRQRSPKDLHQSLGPVIVCLALIAALCINFALKVSHRNAILPLIILFLTVHVVSGTDGRQVTSYTP